MPFSPQQPSALAHSVAEARRHFYAMGWSCRSAARELGVSYQHLSQVLNGHRTSRSVLTKIHALPPRPPRSNAPALMTTYLARFLFSPTF